MMRSIVVPRTESEHSLIGSGSGVKVIEVVVDDVLVLLVLLAGGITLQTLKLSSNSFEEQQPGTEVTGCPIDVRVWCDAKEK